MRHSKSAVLMVVVLAGIGILLPLAIASGFGNGILLRSNGNGMVHCIRACAAENGCGNFRCLAECARGCFSTNGSVRAIPVPVELSIFQARVENGAVILQWATGSETENLGYHIYRGLVEEGEYEKLTVEMIEGAGSSRTIQTYEFIDEDVQEGERYYYQLEQIDFDGTREMHGPVAVSMEATAVQPGTWGQVKSLLK